MRNQILTEQRRRRLPQFPLSDPASFATRATWRTRALRESTAVRRVIRGAHRATNGVLGCTRALDALACGVVSELLLTPRFLESEPVSAGTARALGQAHHVTITTLTGTAALELDLIAGGIGALLRRTSPV